MSRMLQNRMHEALRRSCVATVRVFETVPLTRSAAVAIAAARFGIHPRTVWKWMEHAQ